MLKLSSSSRRQQNGFTRRRNYASGYIPISRFQKTRPFCLSSQLPSVRSLPSVNRATTALLFHAPQKACFHSDLIFSSKKKTPSSNSQAVLRPARREQEGRFPTQQLTPTRRLSSRKVDPQTSRLLNRQNRKAATLASMIRVDHAGEFGAQQIYKGQLAVFEKTNPEIVPTIQHMSDQETVHLNRFEELLTQTQTRPTAFFPLWNAVGFGVGYVSALLGKECAMALTVGVEEVIGNHYNDQLREILDQGWTQEDQDRELKDTLKQFRDDELEHLNTGLHHGAQNMPFYAPFIEAVKLGTKSAVWISSRL